MTERITPNPLRPIGDDPRPDRPDREVATDPLGLLREEFERALALKARLADEKADAKGGQSAQGQQNARSLVASLEGMSRFAMRMGMITAAQSRALFAEAKERGLYDGWSA